MFDLGIGPRPPFGISTRIWISAPVGIYIILPRIYRRPTPCIIYYYHGMAYLILCYYDIHQYRICCIRVPKRCYVGAGCVYCKYVYRSNHRRITALPPYYIYITFILPSGAIAIATFITVGGAPPRGKSPTHHTYKVFINVNIQQTTWRSTSLREEL